MNKIFAPSNCNYSNIIYHYCSLETFVAIMQNKSLRLTNIIKSNDQSEISYALRAITDATKTALTKLSIRFKDNNLLSELLANFNADNYFNGVLTESNLVYYAMCFSQKSDLLSQWRGYANDGNGVAIGFSETMLDRFQGAKDVSMQYAHISYDVNRINDRITEMLDRRFSKLIANANSTLADFENVFSNLLSWVIYQSVFLKNPVFSEEKETRLVYYPFGNIRSLRDQITAGRNINETRYYDRMTDLFDYSGVIHTHGNFAFSKPSFLIKSNKLVSYIDVSFATIAKYFLAEIILGPKTDMDDLDLRLFLLSNGYELNYINIKKSQVPYI